MAKIYTTPQVAEILGVSPSRVRHIASSFGMGQMLGPIRVWTEEEVEFLRSRPKKRGVTKLWRERQ